MGSNPTHSGDRIAKNLVMWYRLVTVPPNGSQVAEIDNRNAIVIVVPGKKRKRSPPVSLGVVQHPVLVRFESLQNYFSMAGTAKSTHIDVE